MPMLSRRGLLALGAGGLMLPRRLFADSSREHKFLFVFCPGGWDVTAVFAPVFNDSIDHSPDDEPATVGGLPIVDSPARPSVHDFFTNWGSRTCMINGMQVPSLAHDVCSRWAFTGTSRDVADDWSSIIAGKSNTGRIIPNIHLSGPLYPHDYASASVRVGLAGQLSSLSDGRALTRYDGSPPVFIPERDALEEAFVRARVDRWAARAPAGQPSRIAIAEQLALSRSERIKTISEQLDPGGIDLYHTVSVATQALASGLSRTGVVAYGGGGNGAWDTHSGNFTTLKKQLPEVDRGIANLVGELHERGMGDDVAVVMWGEFGRTPKVNSSAGRDHWSPVMSALVAGGGMKMGQMVGSSTARGERPKDRPYTVSNLLATLYGAMGIDPAMTFNNGSGRPVHLLEDRGLVTELA